MESGLTHFDENGKALMVDVTDKGETVREATAAGKSWSAEKYMKQLQQEQLEKEMFWEWRQQPGIMGAKRTAELIPMCHILPITNCRVTFDMDEESCTIYCYCTVKVTGKTGVEMEALTGSVLHF